jgi:hypothetical protein
MENLTIIPLAQAYQKGNPSLKRQKKGTDDGKFT